MSENTIIDTLETRVAVNSLSESCSFSLAEVPTQEVVDGELSFSAVIQQVEDMLDLLKSAPFRLPLQVIDEDGVVDALPIFRQFPEDKFDVFTA